MRSQPKRTRVGALERAHQLLEKGQLGGAQGLYEQVLRATPDDEEALLGLSLVWLRSGHAERARELLQGAVARLPDSAPLFTNLGEAQRQLGRLPDAVHSFEQALALDPQASRAAFNLGVAQQALGHGKLALDWLLRAVCVSPDDAAMQQYLADALWDAGEHARALAHQQAAWLAAPSLAAVLAHVRKLAACKLHDAVIASCERALELDPGHPEALLRKGVALLASERLGEAASVLRRAAELVPEHALPDGAVACFRSGRADEAVDMLRRACSLEGSSALHANLVFACSFDTRLGAEDLLREARGWARLYASAQLPRPPVVDPCPTRKLRIGYVSPDFWDHCQALFMLPLLAAHDRSQVEVVCYASVRQRDARTAQIERCADRWVAVGELDDEALAQRIRDDQIDVLIDLTMHMAGGRLRAFALRPAPVQISWLAYPGTTGLTQIDYRISDPALEGLPAVDVPTMVDLPQYSERTLLLPDAFWCYDPLEGELEPGPLPSLQTGAITFGCLNNPAKLNEGVYTLWSAVMRAVAGSRLLLRLPRGEPRARAQAFFERAGIAGDRLTFVDRKPRRAYLETYRRIDICLDTLPYNGHTVSLDALWMGVPVVSCVGSTIVGRAGLSQATQLDLRALVAHDEAEFVRIACALANDRERLCGYRTTLRARMERSPLMDATRFARNLEAALRLAWREVAGV